MLEGNTMKVHINPQKNSSTGLFGDDRPLDRTTEDRSNVKTFMKTLLAHRDTSNHKTKKSALKTRNTTTTKKTRANTIIVNPAENEAKGCSAIELPIRIRIDTDKHFQPAMGPKLKINVGGAMPGALDDPGTPPPLDLGSPEIRIKKAPYQNPKANDPTVSDIEVNKNNLYEEEHLMMGLGLKDFNALAVPVTHQNVASLVDWLQIYQDCMRFAVNSSLGVIDRTVQWNGSVSGDLAPAPKMPASIEEPLKELQCVPEESDATEDGKSELRCPKGSEGCLSTMESELMNLERTRGGLYKSFEMIAGQLKQRFSEADDTFLLLDGLILSERALMEWHRLWADANGARRADVRQATEHAVHALISSVVAIVEGVRKNAETVLQEYKSYEESAQLIAPSSTEKDADETKRSSKPSRWSEIGQLKQRYVQFLETKLCRKSTNTHVDQTPCIILARATRDVLNAVDPVELLPALRTGMQDVQVQLDKWALAVSPSNSSTTLDVTKSDLDKSARSLSDARAVRAQLAQDLDKVDQALIEHWAKTKWHQIKEMHEKRRDLVSKLKEADELVREADALVGAQLKKRIDAMQHSSNSKDAEFADADGQEIVMLSSEHRYNFLNELDNLTAQLHTEIYAQPKGLSELYYRFQDIIQSETKQVLCTFRAIATQKIYEQGNLWAQTYADNAHALHEQWRKLEHFLRNQKSTLDDAVLQQKQRLVVRFDITDEQFRKLLKTVYEYEDVSFRLMEMLQRKQNVLALKGLRDRLLAIDFLHK